MPHSLDNTDTRKKHYAGIGFAIITVIIWSGNYVVARGIARQLPPVSLAFYRWLLATICISPFAARKCITQKKIIIANRWYIFWTAISGITIFNTFIYLGGHYTSAINLALIGTTAAPIFTTCMAVMFLGEKAGAYRVTGMAICFAGILVLLSQGSLQQLAGFHFAKGDLLVIISAFSFAVYNTLVKKKPPALSPIGFLFTVFATGTLCLLPFYVYEFMHSPAVHWTPNMFLIIAYLGIGNSIIGFFGWNAAVARLGAAETSLFANLIPLFSTVEAVLFLGETFSLLHLLSGLLLIGGLIIASLRSRRRQNG